MLLQYLKLRFNVLWCLKLSQIYFLKTQMSIEKFKFSKEIF